MNSAYKWYSHNTNIIQFYSGFVPSKKVSDSVDFAQYNISDAYDNSDNFADSYKKINLS